MAGFLLGKLSGARCTAGRVGHDQHRAHSSALAALLAPCAGLHAYAQNRPFTGHLLEGALLQGVQPIGLAPVRAAHGFELDGTRIA